MFATEGMPCRQSGQGGGDGAVACRALNAPKDPVLVLRVEGTIRLANAAAWGDNER